MHEVKRNGALQVPNSRSREPNAVQRRVRLCQEASATARAQSRQLGKRSDMLVVYVREGVLPTRQRSFLVPKSLQNLEQYFQNKHASITMREGESYLNVCKRCACAAMHMVRCTQIESRVFSCSSSIQ